MRVSDSIPVLNQVRFVVVLGCGWSCPLCCVTITAVCVWGDMSSGCNAPRRFQPTTVWVQGAPTSRINQALELSVPIKQPCPSNRRAAGYRRSAHPQLQLNLLFWDAPSLRLPCWPTTTTTSYCAGTYLVPGGGRSLLCQPAGTAGPDSRIISIESGGGLILDVEVREVATEASLGTGVCH